MKRDKGSRLNRWEAGPKDRVLMRFGDVTIELARSDDGKGVQVRGLEGTLVVRPEAANTVTVEPVLWFPTDEPHKEE